MLFKRACSQKSIVFSDSIKKVCCEILWGCSIHIHELIFVLKEKKIEIKSRSFSDVKNFVLGFLCTGFFDQIKWPVAFVEASSISDNANRYFTCVYILIEVKLVEIISSVTLLVYWCVYITISWKLNTFLSKWICAYNFVSVKILKKHWLLYIKIFHKYKLSYPILWTSTFETLVYIFH